MSLLTYNFESQYLQIDHQITVILPDKPRTQTPEEFYRGGKKFPVLWLLHGTFGANMDWIRRTNIELYASERNLIVVMPQALNSNYANWNDYMMGYRMFDYLTEELMPLIYGWLPASDKPEDNFIAGLSMGGRGTLVYALNHPDKFAAAAVLSAVPLNNNEMRPGHPCPLLDTENERTASSIRNAGGLEAYLNSYENDWDLFDRRAESGDLPRMLFAIGEEDELLYEHYLIFKKHCEEKGYEAEWFTLPGYRHEWRFWDKAIQKALDFFGLEIDGGNPF